MGRNYNRKARERLTTYREAVQRFENIRRMTVAAGCTDGKASTIAATLGGEWSVVYWSAAAAMATMGFLLVYCGPFTRTEILAEQQQAIADMERER